MQRYYGIDLDDVPDRVSVVQAASCAAYLPDDGAVARAQHGGIPQWSVSEYLQADMANSLRKLWWSKTQDAEHGWNKPEMITPPGIQTAEQSDVFTGTVDEIKVILAKPRKENTE